MTLTIIDRVEEERRAAIRQYLIHRDGTIEAQLRERYFRTQRRPEVPALNAFGEPLTKGKENHRE